MLFLIFVKQNKKQHVLLICGCSCPLLLFMVGHVVLLMTMASPLATASSRPCRAFVELCCDKDSMFGRIAPAYGVDLLRITEADRFDQPRGLEKASCFIRERSHVDAWAALPCTPWCTWQLINEAELGPKYAARLAWRRRKALKMIGHVDECFKDAVASGGGAHFEWPRRCCGWQRRKVRALIRRAGLLLADFDGCAFGVEARPGVLALKLWRLGTTRSVLAKRLKAFKCTKDHLMVPCLGVLPQPPASTL